MSKPPPPRYKIVERGGRLVTIDTWAKDAPAPSPAEPPMRPRATTPPQSGGQRWLAALGDLLLAAVVRTRDAQGRRLLATDASWDRHGPRAIALSRRGEQRLGRAFAIALLAVLAGLAAAMIDTDLFLVVLFLAVLAVSLFATALQAPVTRFLDSLDDGAR